MGLIFLFFFKSTENMVITYNLPMTGIQTAGLRYWKRLPCQLSHNHLRPLNKFLVPGKLKDTRSTIQMSSQFILTFCTRLKIQNYQERLNQNCEKHFYFYFCWLGHPKMSFDYYPSSNE